MDTHNIRTRNVYKLDNRNWLLEMCVQLQQLGVWSQLIQFSFSEHKLKQS